MDAIHKFLEVETIDKLPIVLECVVPYIAAVIGHQIEVYKTFSPLPRGTLHTELSTGMAKFNYHANESAREWHHVFGACGGVCIELCTYMCTLSS